MNGRILQRTAQRYDHGNLSRGQRLLISVAGLLLCLAAAPLSLRAQFNGPATTAKETVNAEHLITTSPEILYPPLRDVLIHIGDELKVTIYGTDYTSDDRVNTSGTIYLPLVDRTSVVGLTLHQAEQLIAQRLRDADMYKNPEVRVQVLDSPQSIITLLGEAKGTVTTTAGGRRLFDVLAAVGGLPPTASHIINIDRPGLPESINVDLGSDPEKSKYANIPIFPGDTITTGSIGRYYMIGAFKNQTAVALTSAAPVTVLQALASANGKLWEAKIDQIHLIRTVGNRRTMTIVNMKEILKGHDPDPVLQADDILYAPSSPVRAALRSGGLTTAIGIGITIFNVLRY